MVFDVSKVAISGLVVGGLVYGSANTQRTSCRKEVSLQLVQVHHGKDVLLFLMGWHKEFAVADKVDASGQAFGVAICAQEATVEVVDVAGVGCVVLCVRHRL